MREKVRIAIAQMLVNSYIFLLILVLTCGYGETTTETDQDSSYATTQLLVEPFDQNIIGMEPVKSEGSAEEDYAFEYIGKQSIIKPIKINAFQQAKATKRRHSLMRKLERRSVPETNEKENFLPCLNLCQISCSRKAKLWLMSFSEVPKNWS